MRVRLCGAPSISMTQSLRKGQEHMELELSIRYPSELEMFR